MLQEPTVVHSEPAGQPHSHIVHAMMQFLVALRYRKNVVLTALAAAALVGGLYYATATRYYRADAAILVMGSGDNGRGISGVAEGTRQQNLMATFEDLFTRPKVVEGALQYLRPEDRIDLAGAPEEAWAAILRRELSAQVARGTNIIEISYLSRDPKAAVSVVNAVVNSYQVFLDKTHKGTAGEVIRVFTREKAQLAEALHRKELEWGEARRRAGDIRTRSEKDVRHPLVETALHFNEQLFHNKDERLALESSVISVHAAIRNGEDLQQQAFSVAKTVGEEILMTRLGFNNHDTFLEAQLEQQLWKAQAELKTLRGPLGVNHPDVQAQTNIINTTRQQLLENQHRVQDRLAEIQNTQLGPMLVDMVQQKLREVVQTGISLQAEYERAKAEAVAVTGQLAEMEIIEHDIEWLRKMKELLLDKIAELDLKHEGQEVRTAVVHEPVEASNPISPNLRRVILMVLLGGLAMGMGAVYVLDVLDDRFRSLEEMQAQLNVPVLSIIQQLNSTDTCGIDALQAYVTPNAAECEAFRTLRTALALAETELRQIVISSAEPGDGKTTVLANLAVSYAQSNKKTLLIDADLRRPGLTTLMGMRGIDGLSGLVRGAGKVVEMATTHIRASGLAGLDVLPSGPRPTNPAELLAHPRFFELLAWAETTYDQILIDSPPALATSDTAVIGRLVDGVVMVVQPHKNRRRSVMRATESFAKLKIPLLGIVVNRIGPDSDRGYYGYGNGYGYGYSYSGAYGSDEEPGDVMTTGETELVARVNCNRRSTYEEVDPCGGIIPRRIT